MKNSYYEFIGICIIILIFVIIVNMYVIKKIEYFENISTDIGNFLCMYFYNIALHFIEGKDCFQEIPEQEFLKNLPAFLPLDNVIQDKLITNEFTKEELEKEMNYNTVAGAWLVNNNRRGLFWELMKPFIHKIMDNAFMESGLKSQAIKNTQTTICIHFRCSDIPFERLNQYHLQKYSYFKKCLEDVSHLGYKKIKLVSCSFHRSLEENQTACEKYIDSLVQYLSRLGYSVETQCNSNIEDFATLFYAPVTISTGGSYSFMSGFFGNGIFVAEGHYIDDENFPDSKCTNCEWLKHGHCLRHFEVDDYYDTDDVVSLLRDNESY
jgi:hypothetical protein